MRIFVLQELTDRNGQCSYDDVRTAFNNWIQQSEQGLVVKFSILSVFIYLYICFIIIKNFLQAFLTFQMEIFED